MWGGGKAGRCLCWGWARQPWISGFRSWGWKCQITSDVEPRDLASEGQVYSAVPHTRVGTPNPALWALCLAPSGWGLCALGPSAGGGQDAGFVPGGKAPGPGWGRGRQGWRKAALETWPAALACLGPRGACLLMRDQPTKTQAPQCPLSVRRASCPQHQPPGQAVIVPGHLSRGNALVPGSLWVAGPEPGRLLAGRGHCLEP